MHECTYSKDPPIKKRKKFLDGFVESKGDKVYLFDEDKKSVYSSSKYFIDEDECFRMGIYTIVIENFEFLSKTPDKNENISSQKNETFENLNVISVDFNHSAGRNKKEILEIFKNK